MTRTYLLGAADLVAVMARDVWPPAARDPGPERDPPPLAVPAPAEAGEARPREARTDDG